MGWGDTVHSYCYIFRLQEKIKFWQYEFQFFEQIRKTFSVLKLDHIVLVTMTHKLAMSNQDLGSI